MLSQGEVKEKEVDHFLWEEKRYPGLSKKIM